MDAVFFVDPSKVVPYQTSTVEVHDAAEVGSIVCVVVFSLLGVALLALDFATIYKSLHLFKRNIGWKRSKMSQGHELKSTTHPPPTT